MNYLAHFYLAGDDEGLIVGNLLADYVKGNKYTHLPENIQRGIILHRNIDDFTDNHNQVEKTKSRLRAKYRKYAPVISDVFYDFILGSNWHEYSDSDLQNFSAEVYKTLESHLEIMPMQAQMTVAYMAKNDWLYNYSNYFGIEMALKGLSRRARFETNMHEAVADLKAHRPEIEKEFRPFFEDIQSYVKELTLKI